MGLKRSRVWLMCGLPTIATPQIPASVDGTDLSAVFDDPSRTDLKEAAFVEAAVCKLKGNGTLWGNDDCPEEGWEGFMGCAPPPCCSDRPPALTLILTPGHPQPCCSSRRPLLQPSW